MLFDFGLARFIDQEWDGLFAGTALYTSPEVPPAAKMLMKRMIRFVFLFWKCFFFLYQSDSSFEETPKRALSKLPLRTVSLLYPRVSKNEFSDKKNYPNISKPWQSVLYALRESVGDFDSPGYLRWSA